MKYAQAQKEVLAQLIKNPGAVINFITPDPRVVLSPDGAVAYVFPQDCNWIDLERIEKAVSLSPVRLPLQDAANKLEPTEHLRDSGGILSREFKKQWSQGERESVYIQEKYLKNFDLPTFYQDISNPKGVVVITETTQPEGEHMVGFVQPIKPREE